MKVAFIMCGKSYDVDEVENVYLEIWCIIRRGEGVSRGRFKVFFCAVHFTVTIVL